MEIITSIIASITVIVVVAIIMGSVVYCSRLDSQIENECCDYALLDHLHVSNADLRRKVIDLDYKLEALKNASGVSSDDFERELKELDFERYCL